MTPESKEPQTGAVNPQRVVQLMKVISDYFTKENISTLEALVTVLTLARQISLGVSVKVPEEYEIVCALWEEMMASIPPDPRTRKEGAMAGIA